MTHRKKFSTACSGDFLGRINPRFFMPFRVFNIANMLQKKPQRETDPLTIDYGELVFYDRLASPRKQPPRGATRARHLQFK